MTTTVVADSRLGESAMEVTDESLKAQFSSTRGFEWPWTAIYRERLVIAAGATVEIARNMCGFMSLFPAMGEVFERGDEAKRILEYRGAQASYVRKELSCTKKPYSWENLSKSLAKIVLDVNDNLEIGLEVLRHNNLPRIEQGVRSNEFRAMHHFVHQEGHKSLLEVFKDGVFFFGSRINEMGKVSNIPEIIWKNVIENFLYSQYLLDGANRDNQALHDIIKKVGTLPPGALYAFATVLSRVYELPSPELARMPETMLVPPPPKFAPNPTVWIEEWYKVMPKVKVHGSSAARNGARRISTTGI